MPHCRQRHPVLVSLKLPRLPFVGKIYHADHLRAPLSQDRGSLSAWHDGGVIDERRGYCAVLGIDEMTRR
jgi:hypothetical protein